MDEQDKVAWLARRAGFGFAAGELDARARTGAAAWLDEHVAPDARGVPAVVNPFTVAPFTDQPTSRRADGVQLLDTWMQLLHTTPRPLQAAMTWFWHDHFAVSYPVVKAATPFARYLDRLHANALGNFRTLITEITTDAAMLLFLDGTTSTAAAPNENYARELLELYTIGVGNFTEADVRAGAVALAGWVVRPREDHRVQLVAARRSTVPQVVLGRTVRDAAGVVDAAVSAEACATFVAGKLAAWFLGPDHDPSLVPGFARVFRDSGLAIAPLVKAVLTAGLEGRGGDLVLAPFPWLATAQRALGARLPARVAYTQLELAGQLPLVPPNVGGWPGPAAWLGASATAARVSMASALIDTVPATNPVLRAAASGDLALLARLLGRPGGFRPPTVDALRGLAASRPTGKAGAAVTAVALASPDLVLA
jgi:uncharacterized protein (DUF1800 family)